MRLHSATLYPMSEFTLFPSEQNANTIFFLNSLPEEKAASSIFIEQWPADEPPEKIAGIFQFIFGFNPIRSIILSSSSPIKSSFIITLAQYPYVDPKRVLALGGDRIKFFRDKRGEIHFSLDNPNDCSGQPRMPSQPLAIEPRIKQYRNQQQDFSNPASFFTTRPQSHSAPVPPPYRSLPAPSYRYPTEVEQPSLEATPW